MYFSCLFGILPLLLLEGQMGNSLVKKLLNAYWLLLKA
jgi:hypothetical protein